MRFTNYSFADLKALINELNKRLTDPLMVLKYEEYRTILINANKEIDKRLDALISPQKESISNTLSQKDEKLFLQAFNNITGHNHRMLDAKAKGQLVVIIKNEYAVNFNEIEKAIKSAFKDMTERETVKHLTPEFITRPAQFSKYLNMKHDAPKSNFVQA